MATLILVRHGRSTANTAGTLAGRLPGIELDETGRAQVAAVGERLAPVPLRLLAVSPLTRCQQTADAIHAHQPDVVRRTVDGISECDYGQWQGRSVREIAEQEAETWRVVQHHPSAVTFPGGESMVAMSHRVVDAVRALDREVEAAHGREAVWAAVSHGDPIKTVLADALGLHLDQFQRIHVDPASVSIIRFTPDRPVLLASNTHGGDLSWLAPRTDDTGTLDEPEGAVVGGGAGPQPTRPNAT